MAFKLNKLLSLNLNPTKCFLRHKSQRRCLGKPPGVARNLEQRLQEINYKDPTLFYKVNIGYSLPKISRRQTTSEHIEVIKRNKNDKSLYESARDNKLLIPLDEVEAEWSKSVGPSHIKTIADHYAVYDHLFGDAYFYPVVPLTVRFLNDEDYIPVYRGNTILPNAANLEPEVKFEADKDSLWTLILTTPDGHLESEKLEYVHWFVGNIKGNDLKKGEIVHDYLQPLPLKGLGYLRYIFILYKQEKQIDFSNLKKELSGDLNNRSFSTLDFYRKHQDEITPAGLSFFTAHWDESVRKFYNRELNSECPEFIYDFPQHFYKPQEWFPLKRPFNLYLDRYRDEKEIAKEHLVKQLKKIDPFKPKAPKLKYPNAQYFKPGTPSWLKNEMIKERLGWSRYNDYEL